MAWEGGFWGVILEEGVWGGGGVAWEGGFWGVTLEGGVWGGGGVAWEVVNVCSSSITTSTRSSRCAR